MKSTNAKPIARNGLYWAKTGQVQVEEAQQTLLTELRFYEKIVCINTTPMELGERLGIKTVGRRC